jgi:ligand-binding sensor domain-containing protein
MAVWDQDRGLAGDTRHINDIAIDSAGILWLGTDNGLVRLDPATGNVTGIDGSHWVPPAPGRNVDAVAIDAAGVKWLATNDGVVQYSGN